MILNWLIALGGAALLLLAVILAINRTDGDVDSED